MYFNLKEYKKFTDMISDSMLQLIFKNNPLQSFGVPSLSEKAIKDFLPPAIYVYDAKFSLYTSTKMLYRNMLHTEAYRNQAFYFLVKNRRVAKI